MRNTPPHFINFVKDAYKVRLASLDDFFTVGLQQIFCYESPDGPKFVLLVKRNGRIAPFIKLMCVYFPCLCKCKEGTLLCLTLHL